MSGESSYVEIRNEKGIVTACLNRPEVSNALTISMVDTLLALTTDLEQGQCLGQPARILVLRGKGNNFCAGADINGLVAFAQCAQWQQVHEHNKRFGLLLLKLSRLPCLVVSCVQGGVIGGGVGLAAASDIVISEVNAYFQTPEAKLGIPPAQIIPFLQRRMGAQQTKHMVVSGRKFDAATVSAYALVDVLVDRVQSEEVSLMLSRYSELSPSLVKSIKLQITSKPHQINHASVVRAADLFVHAIQHGSGRHGLRAFINNQSGDARSSASRPAES